MAYAKTTNRHDFAYTIGVIRTLETLLLNSNEVERMALAKDAEEAFRIFDEMDYADNTAGIKSASEFQHVIKEGLVDIKQRLSEITPNKKVLNIIFFNYDFHNIKTMIKAKFSGKTYEEISNLISDLGAIKPEALKEFIFEGNNTFFSLDEKSELFIKEHIKAVQKLFKKEDENPQVIDLYLDEKLMEIIYEIAKDFNSPYLISYLEKLIDLTNIRLFFRMKLQEKAFELFEVAFLHNGKVPLQKFKTAYSQRLDEFGEVMKSTDYGRIVESGLKHYQEEKTLIYLEKEAENHLTSYIKQAKQMAFGPEPLIAYFLAKQNNALIIRMLMISKLNNIDPEEIKGRIRDIYA